MVVQALLAIPTGKTCGRNGVILEVCRSADLVRLAHTQSLGSDVQLKPHGEHSSACDGDNSDDAGESDHDRDHDHDHDRRHIDIDRDGDEHDEKHCDGEQIYTTGDTRRGRFDMMEDTTTGEEERRRRT